jgi:tetratricopeptide (TPR) repeat protein
MIKKLWGGLLLICALSGAFSQSQSQTQSPFGKEAKPYWWTLEQGKLLFRQQDYGNALIAFEDARNDRRAMYTRMEQDWIALLSIGEVRRFRDSLEPIEAYIEERGQYDAAAALAEVRYRVGNEALHNSAQTVLDYFGRLKAYPEAEYWIGEAYRVEGEFVIALRQYEEALKQKSNLQESDFAIEIQYKIAALQEILQNYNAAERQLLGILTNDTLWNQDDSSFVKTAMRRTLENNGINQFLSMYRYKNAEVEKAHRLLGSYCYLSGRHNRAAEHLMFAVLIQNSTIIDEAIDKRFDFKFTTLDALMAEIARRQDLRDYMKETDYYKTLYYLGASLYAIGKTNAARGIWTFIAGRSDSLEWNGRAKRQLANPFVEKAVEMP